MKCPLFNKEVYVTLLPFFFTTNTCLGFIVGTTIHTNNKPIDSFLNPVGYSFIGMITSITFPVSYPLIGAYVLYNNYNTYKNLNNTKHN